ncbi:ketopantoate reductase family protein [Sulfobacillus harzensis]|uniref:2-dehydropantoate 2-reductase n=1 Tax=Sulfobacillus harzensis TaxID=2729629 RepID=A0A7Y0LAK2_9FIRM|nr:ketopantoate reductase family protein [Sulfobacillus harzensis]NMP24894.1 ketopantoate reductase family protein [Sulfobacillus harzensis]
MNIVVFGAGAVGGYFGGRLAAAGAPVTFLVRERRAQQLMTRELVIHSVHGDVTLKPRLVLTADAVESPDLVILAVKNYHLNVAMPDLGKLVAKGATILPLLNGVQHLETLVDAFGRDRVLGGACYIEARLSPEGDVVQTSPMQDITFGPLGAIEPGFLNEIQAWFQKAQIPSTLSEAIMVDMWLKYIFLASLSGITAAVRKPVGGVLEDPAARDLLHDLVQEIAEIALRTEPGLPAGIADAVLARFYTISGSMTSSMHRDLENGRPLEVESLQGALLNMARGQDIATPHLASIYAVLHPWRNGRPAIDEP